ncbi:hypothetical protein LINGRAHAP2_LOCUS17528 [Linum grandiflorum]
MMNNKEETSDSPYCYFHPKEAVIGICPLCLHERLLILLAATDKKQRRQNLSSSSSSSANCSSTPQHKKKPSILFSLGSLLINRLEFRHHHPKSYDDDDDDDESNNNNNPDCGFGYDDYDDASTSHEDSFISIQFQDNGKASWEQSVGLVSDDKKSHEKKKIDHLSNDTNKKKKKLNGNIHSYKDQNKINTTINPISSSCSSKAEATIKSIHLKEDEMSVVEHGKPRGGGSLRWRKRIGHMFHLVRWKRSSKANTCHVGSKVEGVIKVRSNKGWNLRTLTKRRSTRE